MADVGKNMKRIRKEKNLTQDDLAGYLHCTRQTISNYENGRSEPGIDLLIEIAGVLGVEVDELIYGLKEKEDRRKQKAAAVIVLMTAILMLIGAALLAPLAERYTWREMNHYPTLLLRITIRPMALMLFGWGLVATITELFEIPMKRARHKRLAALAHDILLVCLSILAAAALWLGVDMAWSWYMQEKLFRAQSSFSSADIPHLLPQTIELVVVNAFFRVSDWEVWYCPLLGGAFAACSKMKKG